jgi:hypothetical protein
MSSFVKLVAGLSAVLLATAVAAEKADDEKSRKPRDKESGDKKSKKDKGRDQQAEADAPPKAIDVPMPNGRDAIGLNIPYRDEEGKLQMRFIIGVATKIDDTHVRMAQLQVETFDASGESEMIMDFPTSVLDLTTSVLTAQQPVTIKRKDFELTGNTMTFNTKTKQGGLGGKVRMLIYDLNDETAQPSTTPEPKAK